MSDPKVRALWDALVAFRTLRPKEDAPQEAEQEVLTLLNECHEAGLSWWIIPPDVRRFRAFNPCFLVHATRRYPVVVARALCLRSLEWNPNDMNIRHVLPESIWYLRRQCLYTFMGAWRYGSSPLSRLPRDVALIIARYAWRRNLCPNTACKSRWLREDQYQWCTSCGEKMTCDGRGQHIPCGATFHKPLNRSVCSGCSKICTGCLVMLCRGCCVIIPYNGHFCQLCKMMKTE